MRKQHLDALALMARLLERLCLSECTSDIAGILIHVARDLSRRCLRTTLRLQRACIAIALGSEVAKRVVGADGPGGGQQLPLRAHINIAILVEGEVVSAQGAIIAVGFVDDRNVRRDLLVVDKPVEVRRRPVGRIGSQPLGLDVEAWAHGYAYQYNSLYDDFWFEGRQTPCERARKPFGRLALANADASAYSYTDAAIDNALRAVREVATLP